MKVLLATSEAVPYAKTGGLADVAGALADELRNLGLDARLIMPLYRGIKRRFPLEDTGLTVRVPLGRDALEGRLFTHGDHAVFIECDEFFDRQELYGTSRGDYEDNAFRFIFFSRAVLEACLALGFIPDIIHCNDWQTGLVPLYVKTLYHKPLGDTATLLTIHNLGFQGLFPESAMALTGLGSGYFTMDVMEYYGKVNLLKAGITSADAVSTVSETYAKEILEEDYGFGLEGVLRTRAADLYGIPNGIQERLWNPATDTVIPRNFSAADTGGKRECRKYLLRECNFSDTDLPVVGMVGRLSYQKGIDIFIEAADAILSSGANLVILGKGDSKYQNGLRRLSRKFPAHVSLNIGFDEDVSRLIYAGSDMIIIPSRYEPCGLTQMIGMSYGTVPVARATGGLKDTIEDFDQRTEQGTGFLFAEPTASALHGCYKRALCVYTNRDVWGKIVENCMKADFSWSASARRYESLYREVLKRGSR